MALKQQRELTSEVPHIQSQYLGARLDSLLTDDSTLLTLDPGPQRG